MNRKLSSKLLHPIAASGLLTPLWNPLDIPGRSRYPLAIAALVCRAPALTVFGHQYQGGEMFWKAFLEKPWKTHGNHIQHHQRIEHISNIEQEYYMCIVDPTFAPKNLPLGATCLLVQK